MTTRRRVLEQLRRVLCGRALRRALLDLAGDGLHLPERAEQHVRERAVHRLAHHDRQDQARCAVERAGRDEQLVLHHEAHRDGGETGVGIQQRDDRRHVGAADRQHEQHAERERQHDERREQIRAARVHHQHDGNDDRRSEQREVDDVLAAIHDRPRRNHFLQLAGGDQAARAREVAEDHFERDRAHAERRQLIVLGPEEVLRRADEPRGEAAERVRQRRSLRHGGQRHPRQRNARRARRARTGWRSSCSR